MCISHSQCYSDYRSRSLLCLDNRLKLQLLWVGEDIRQAIVVTLTSAAPRKGNLNVGRNLESSASLVPLSLDWDSENLVTFLKHLR